MLEGSILQKLALSSQPSPTAIASSSLNFGVYYKNTLVALCHALEDCILASHSNPLVLTAFQRGKWYLQEAERYSRIADHAKQIVILATPETGFAEHSTSQRPNVALVHLREDDPVAQEWHLIVLSPTYTAMVLCQELPPEDYGPQGPPSVDVERKFYGYWTFDPTLVQEAAVLLIDHIHQYEQQLQQRLTALVSSLDPRVTAEKRDDLGMIVGRVVDYLGESHQQLDQKLSLWRHVTALEQNLISNESQALLRMAQLVDLTDPQAPLAASEVAVLAEMVGQLLDLPAWQLKRLRLAGLLHRIVPKESVVSPESSGEPIMGPCCPLASGLQVLRRMPRLQAIAQIITHQGEWWNGSGQPAGLQGEAIPLESQILSLATEFHRQFTEIQNHPEEGQSPLEQALGQCSIDAQEGRWSPQLLESFALLVRGLQQGLMETMPLPRATHGLSFLDPSLSDHRSTPGIATYAS